MIHFYTFYWPARLKCGQQLEIWTAKPLHAFQNFEYSKFWFNLNLLMGRRLVYLVFLMPCPKLEQQTQPGYTMLPWKAGFHLPDVSLRTWLQCASSPPRKPQTSHIRWTNIDRTFPLAVELSPVPEGNSGHLWQYSNISNRLFIKIYFRYVVQGNIQAYNRRMKITVLLQKTSGRESSTIIYLFHRQHLNHDMRKVEECF